jgi:hypothetical protein
MRADASAPCVNSHSTTKPGERFDQAVRPEPDQSDGACGEASDKSDGELEDVVRDAAHRRGIRA